MHNSAERVNRLAGFLAPCGVAAALSCLLGAPRVDAATWDGGGAGNNWSTAANWSGDIWRLIVLLKKYRPDLSISTIGTPPTGLGLVRNLDPNSRFLFDHNDRLCEEFLALDYSYLDEDMPGKLNLFPNEWGKIRALIE